MDFLNELLTSPKFDKEILQLNQSVHDPCSYGVIVDISESQEQMDCWKTLKITFVNEENIYHNEELLFDTSRNNLSDSADEVINSVESYLKHLDKSILTSFLWDMCTREEAKRYFRSCYTKFSNLVFPFKSFTKHKLRKLKRSYIEIEPETVSDELVQSIKSYENFSYGNRVSDAFSLIFMQKNLIALETIETINDSKINYMNSVITRKSIDKSSFVESPESKSSFSGFDKNLARKNIQKRLEEIMLQQIEDQKEPQYTEEAQKQPSKKPSRENCECKLL